MPIIGATIILDVVLTPGSVVDTPAQAFSASSIITAEANLPTVDSNAAGATLYLSSDGTNYLKASVRGLAPSAAEGRTIGRTTWALKDWNDYQIGVPLAGPDWAWWYVELSYPLCAEATCEVTVGVEP